jgi:ribonuclease P protein component
MRRQIYAVATDLLATLPDAAVVVRLRCAFDRKQFRSAASEPLKAAVRAELQQLFERLANRRPAGVRHG